MVAISSTLREDLYVVYAGTNPDTNLPVIHAYLNPLVKWIWLGGLVVVWSVLHLGPTFFLQRIVDDVGAVHFWVGMSKAPVMAIVIAGIGCRKGLEVGGDVESLGRRVTAAVVHAIFAIIMIDAAFALLFMKLNV